MLRYSGGAFFRLCVLFRPTALGVTLARGNSLKIEFKYDHNGMRVEKKVTAKGDNSVETTRYYYQGKRLVRQHKGNHVLHFYYDAEGRPAMVMHNGTMYTYAHSLQGDISAIVDSAGNLVVEYKYDARGNITHMFGSLVGTLGEMNPFRYRGYVYDVETGLYYLRSRYYNPEWGRFINADTVLGKVGALYSHNLFTYCGNNPIMHYDPSGHVFALPFFMSGAVISTVAALVSASTIDIPAPGSSSWPDSERRPLNRLDISVIITAALIGHAQTKVSNWNTSNKTNDNNNEPQYYLAIAYGGASPVPISSALTQDEAYRILHTASWISNIDTYVANSPYSNIDTYSYGVYTLREKDAENLAKRFGQPRLDLRDGGKYAHYNVETRIFKDIHFWFFY